MSTPTLPPNEPTHHWPLRTLYLCPECEEVSQDANQCPVCANPHVLTLSAVVNREKEEKSDGSGGRIVQEA